jgi:DNA polymerase-3 subunit beta
MEYNDSNAQFAENTTIICRLIDGKYPEYEAVVIPRRGT